MRGGEQPSPIDEGSLENDNQEQDSHESTPPVEGERKLSVWERFKRKVIPQRKSKAAKSETGAQERQPKTLEELYEFNGYKEELAHCRELAGGDQEKLDRLLKEGLFVKNAERLANQSDEELNKLNPYVETGKDRFEEFKKSTKKRALVKLIVTGGVVAIGAGVAMASGGTLIPAVAGVAAKAFGLGSLASFTAGTAVDAARFWKEDANKKELAGMVEVRHKKIKHLCQRIVRAHERGHIVESGQAVNLQRAKLDLLEYATEIENPESLENQQIKAVRERIIASEKSWRKRRIIASFLAGFTVSSVEILSSAKEILHNVEVQGFEMHGDGLGDIVHNIKEFDPNFEDQTSHFVRSIPDGPDADLNDEVIFETDSATHDAVHQAVSNHQDYWGKFNDFKLDNGAWGHDLGAEGTAQFKALASEYTNYLATGTIASLGAAFVADGVAEGFAFDSTQNASAKIDETRLNQLMDQLGGSTGISESADFEATENRRIGEELILKKDDIIVGPEDKPLKYTKDNRFLLEDYREGVYYVRPYDKEMSPIDDAFPLKEDDFNQFFRFTRDVESQGSSDDAENHVNGDKSDLDIKLGEEKALTERLTKKHEGKIETFDIDQFGNTHIFDDELGNFEIKVRKDRANVFIGEHNYLIESVVVGEEGDLEIILFPERLPEDLYEYKGEFSQGPKSEEQLDEFTKAAEELRSKGEKVIVRSDNGKIYEYTRQESLGRNIQYVFIEQGGDASKEVKVGSKYMQEHAVDWYIEKKAEEVGRKEVSPYDGKAIELLPEDKYEYMGSFRIENGSIYEEDEEKFVKEANELVKSGKKVVVLFMDRRVGEFVSSIGEKHSRTYIFKGEDGVDDQFGPSLWGAIDWYVEKAKPVDEPQRPMGSAEITKDEKRRMPDVMDEDSAPLGEEERIAKMVEEDLASLGEIDCKYVDGEIKFDEKIDQKINQIAKSANREPKVYGTGLTIPNGSTVRVRFLALNESAFSQEGTIYFRAEALDFPPHEKLGDYERHMIVREEGGEKQLIKTISDDGHPDVIVRRGFDNKLYLIQGIKTNDAGRVTSAWGKPLDGDTLEPAEDEKVFYFADLSDWYIKKTTGGEGQGQPDADAESKREEIKALLEAELIPIGEVGITYNGINFNIDLNSEMEKRVQGVAEKTGKSLEVSPTSAIPIGVSAKMKFTKFFRANSDTLTLYVTIMDFPPHEKLSNNERYLCNYDGNQELIKAIKEEGRKDIIVQNTEGKLLLIDNIELSEHGFIARVQGKLLNNDLKAEGELVEFPNYELCDWYIRPETVESGKGETRGATELGESRKSPEFTVDLGDGKTLEIRVGSKFKIDDYFVEITDLKQEGENTFALTYKYNTGETSIDSIVDKTGTIEDWQETFEKIYKEGRLKI